MTYLICASSPSLLGKSAVKIIILFLLEGGNFKQSDNNGTNACAFLFLKIAGPRLHSRFSHHQNFDWKLYFFSQSVSTVFGDVDQCYDID